MLTPAELRWLRRLAAVLTVVASFMFTLRQDGLGRLGSSSASAPAAMAQMAGMDMGAGHYHHHQTSEAPTALPTEGSSHHHSSHCPFCISNAFALEAGVVGLPNAPPEALAQPEWTRRFVLPRLKGTVNARAPPFL